ncbi:hypothetical protein H072_5176 [Dactylellina haptotyla CBS 200.50]|uniref:protein-histidine N-methyltransferase n=1 Tax=Dactylellina haptotyla (strain CBS 200.50) TaxID=1284197 RepID=S8AD63_DACHA|nr:hypothetical protein H072_5176 [Dactylellina haptotyla CBS 200.50]
MSFKFNFDLPADEAETGAQTNGEMDADTATGALSDSSRIPAQSHTLDELMAKLPPHIAYSTLKIPRSSSHTVSIPRRELFDVKMQLMTEDNMASSDPNTQGFSAAFTDEDIRTNTYEGGLKSWECSSDLVKQLADDVDTWKNSAGRIIELGCGTALPSCYILQTLLSSSNTHPTHITLADYNIDVLRLVTLPNLLLAYLQTNPDLLTRSEEAAPEETEVETEHPIEPREIELSQTILTSFLTALSSRNITISFLSGSWSPTMISLIHGTEYPSTNPEKMYSLLLASETIYSLDSIPPFVDMIEHTLDATHGTAYIAAKDVYFGVGGSVKDFVAFVESKQWKWTVVREEKRGVGVGRVVGLVRKTE